LLFLHHRLIWCCYKKEAQKGGKMPTVSITAPTNGETFRLGQTVKVTGTAGGDPGPVSEQNHPGIPWPATRVAIEVSGRWVDADLGDTTITDYQSNTFYSKDLKLDTPGPQNITVISYTTVGESRPPATVMLVGLSQSAAIPAIAVLLLSV
jgi:Bacterial Ig domain